ncbi:hypothetical protein COO60DRAFT_1488014, partial [Scenedesmus sp. NREL 46B-D3]
MLLQLLLVLAFVGLSNVELLLEEQYLLLSCLASCFVSVQFIMCVLQLAQCLCCCLLNLGKPGPERCIFLGKAAGGGTAAVCVAAAAGARVGSC